MIIHCIFFFTKKKTKIGVLEISLFRDLKIKLSWKVAFLFHLLLMNPYLHSKWVLRRGEWKEDVVGKSSNNWTWLSCSSCSTLSTQPGNKKICWFYTWCPFVSLTWRLQDNIIPFFLCFCDCCGVGIAVEAEVLFYVFILYSIIRINSFFKGDISQPYQDLMCVLPFEQEDLIFWRKWKPCWDMPWVFLYLASFHF